MPPKFVFKQLKKQPAPGAATTSAVRALQLSPKAASRQKARSEAPFEISVLQYIANAGELLNFLPDDLHDQPLYQIQLRHDAKPGLLMRMIMNFNNFLAFLHTEQPQVPASLQGLRDHGILVQIASAQPGSGAIPWRVSVYVAGDILNALLLLDTFVAWRSNHPNEGDPPFPLPVAVELAIPTTLQPLLAQQVWTCPTRVSVPPRFTPLQGAAPTAHHLTFVCECDAEGLELQGTFMGCTFAFRHALEQHGVFGARTETDDYVRVLPKIDCSKQTARDWFLSTILKDTLKQIVLGVQIIQAPPEGSAAAELVNLLTEQPQVYLLQ